MKLIEEESPRHRNDTTWRGYTLEELRYQQVALRARIDIQRDVIDQGYDRVREGNLFLNRNVFSRVLTMINYTDFMVIGYKLIRRIAPLLSRKK